MKPTDKINNITVADLINIAKIGEFHGSYVIETYLLGNRAFRNESVKIYNKESDKWENCYVYPWKVDSYKYQKFMV